MPRSPGCRHRSASMATCSAPGLRFIRLLPPPGDWTDFRDFAYGWGSEVLVRCARYNMGADNR
jgi:hypothetical protein